MSRREKRVLTIPPGPSFLKTLVVALFDGRLLPGFTYNPDRPETLADVTIFVPTRRSARVLRSEFSSLITGRSAILPVIRPLGETDDDSGFFDAAMPERLDLLPPIGSVPAALELARLIEAWRNRLPKSVVDLHEGAPVIAPASAADAVWLARELLKLIGEMETAEANWDALLDLNPDDYAAWWQLTLEFLKIAHVYWPARLGELNASSPSRHRNAILSAEAERLARGGHKGPVIVAGSTGSLPATARLINAVAGLENGAVVLPGLDKDMPRDHWDQLLLPSLKPDALPDPTLFGHPQYGLARLLAILQVHRDDVEEVAKPDSSIFVRNRAVSMALAPSQMTDHWPAMKADLGANKTADAFASVSLIEAPNERVEASAIAIALKLALDEAESPDSQVALITPDRELARRVVSELERFGIEADDSAGLPLSSTPQGTLLKLVLEATLLPGDPVAVMSLLKHPLMRLGLSAADVGLCARLLEIHALRGGTGAVDISALGPLLAAQIEARAENRHLPAWQAPLVPDDRSAVEDFTNRLSTAVEPLVAALGRSGRDMRSPARTLARIGSGQWAELTGRVLEAIATDEDGSLAALWDTEAGAALADLLSGVMESSEGLQLTGPDWAGVADALVSGAGVKPKAMSHPRVFIWGTQEARQQHVDTVVIGGLNEGAWPQQQAVNPFLSRAMKMALGLEPPERRTGQIAHDFVMASGLPRVIYSRALRAGGAPSVASRFLQRVLAITGPAVASEMRARGSIYLAYADLIDEGERQKPAERPEPKPDPALIPNRYSFSEAGRLRRDPYAIYARRILRLDPVKPFNTDPGPAERGTLYHGIVEAFIKQKIDPASPEAWDLMMRLTDEAFDKAELPSHIAATWRPRFEETARAFLQQFEIPRQSLIRSSYTEARALMTLEGGFELSGIADRIDIMNGGEADIIDYKTGSSPSMKQARTLLDPQLSLEAAALKAGGFKDAGARDPGDLLYVRLRPGDKFQVDKINGDPESSRSKTPPKTTKELAEDATRELTKLLTLLKSGKRGFLSRVIPDSAATDGDYDHLARTAEWATAEGDADGEGGLDG
mgnify:CR=1 FL=1